MGMYTQLSMNFTLKENVKGIIIRRLKDMIDKDAITRAWKDKNSRLNWCFNSSSYYFDNTTSSKIFHDHISNQYRVLIHCDFKNYNDEINTFLNWIVPYIEGGECDKEFIGYQRHEKDDLPTLIFIHKGVIT